MTHIVAISLNFEKQLHSAVMLSGMAISDDQRL